MGDPIAERAQPLITTERLRLRWLCDDDAPFMLALLSDPDFLRFVGDRGVRTVDDARAYIVNGPMASYQHFGFGLYLALRADDDTPVGICGLLKRPELEDVDIGYALLPAFRGRGYAREAAAAVLAHARDTHGLHRVVAIVRPENASSVRVLEQIGMRHERLVQLTADGPESALFGRSL